MKEITTSICPSSKKVEDLNDTIFCNYLDRLVNIKYCPICKQIKDDKK